MRYTTLAIRLLSVAVFAAVLSGIHALHSVRAEDAIPDYGPDWRVCRNLSLDPTTRLEACNRLLEEGKLPPKYLSWTYNNRGTAWQDMEHLKEAFRDFEKAIEIDPTNGPPYYNRGWLEHRAGADAKAIGDIETAIQLKPNDASLRCQLGEILEGMDRLDDAAANYEAGLNITPNDICLRGKHAAVLDRLEHFNEAIADYAKMIELDPSFTGGWVGRAQDYIVLGAYGAAIRDASAALQLQPDDIGALSVRAEALFDDKQYDKSRADCDRVLAAQSDDVSCGDYELRGLLLHGHFQEAAGKASELAGVHNILYFHVASAVAEYGLGSYEQAVRDFKLAVDADPDDPYRVLLAYLADRHLGHDDKARLTELAARNDIWPTPLLRFAVGRLSKAEVLAAADVPDAELRNERLAEANFYLGELAALDGHADTAAEFYKASAAIAEIRLSPRRHLAPYKDHNDFEISLARAALRGSGL
ncbi:MAG TPA: tetratricopeptide repeat protein [Dongiaceae bacterium]|nr:tetratricopeptide repeat protein [Dongiaceae bacterium]